MHYSALERIRKALEPYRDDPAFKERLERAKRNLGTHHVLAKDSTYKPNVVPFLTRHAASKLRSESHEEAVRSTEPKAS